MITLVIGSNLLVLFIGWVGLCSYLLIGFWHKNKSNDAAKKAFIMGDLGLLVGIFILEIYSQL
jgi:NADH-quinone oxidoreductase subunit L